MSALGARAASTLSPVTSGRMRGRGRGEVKNTNDGFVMLSFSGFLQALGVAILLGVLVATRFRRPKGTPVAAPMNETHLG